MLGKKPSHKSAKKRFLYSNEYRQQYMGGKKRAKQFFQKHTNSASKNVAKKIIGKKSEKRFLYLLEYHDQKMAGKKGAEQFFQKQKNSASKKFWEINSRKKCLNRF